MYEEFLAIWDVNESGRSTRLPAEVVYAEIGRINPDLNAADALQFLRTEHWVSVGVDGGWQLTVKGISARASIIGAKSPKIKAVPVDASKELSGSDEGPWLKFRQLCAYYADCVHDSEKSQEYLFDNRLDVDYLLPVLPVDWWKQEQEILIKPSPVQIPALSRITALKDEDAQVYIGYPLDSFVTSNKNLGYSPVFLIPVRVRVASTGTYVSIQRDGIDINRTWLQYNVAPGEQKSVLMGISFLDDERTGLINFEVALQYFINRLKVSLDPNRLNYQIDHADGIINSAALFVGSDLKYSRTLLRELKRIGNESASVLDQTALAYVFRDPPLPNEFKNGRRTVALDFIAANSEQHTAVEFSLNHPAGKVTGPPGTGKSQVAVNLICNLLYQGKSVLFTSKNHKAIHAIDEKVGNACSELPLVQFCSKTDGSAGVAWYNQDIDVQVALYKQVYDKLRGKGEIAVSKTDDALSAQRDCAESISRYEEVRRNLQQQNYEREKASKRIPRELTGVTSDVYKQLRNELGALIDLPPNRTKWRRFLDWILRRSKRAVHARARVEQLVPKFVSPYMSNGTVKTRLEGVLDAMKILFESEASIKSLEAEAAQLDDYEQMLSYLKEAYSTANENQLNALLMKLSTAAKDVPETVKEQVKNASSLLSRQGLAFFSLLISEDDIQLAQRAFYYYSRYFPAWACTLLSLTKASPCMPAIFDRVLVDEASQCDIPPIIPALYRAKGVTVIGDPQQFPPVITMRENRHSYLRMVKYRLGGMDNERFDYVRRNAYSLINIVEPIMLREHFRCHEEIADYFNDEYYGDRLRVCTDFTRLKFPAAQGYRAGRSWRSVKGGVDKEIAEVESILSDLTKSGFAGSVGVVTPFRSVADKMRVSLRRFSDKLEGFDSNKDVHTATGFQGDERDLIIFVLAYTAELKKGKIWYATSAENRYIYNVAVSRARACLIIVGDKDRALESGYSPLMKLAKDPRPRPSRSESPGEEILYRALCEAGFHPVQQRYLAGRYLDMALEDAKIDIEVDGEAYHLTRYGERKPDDTFRDIVISANGWRVKRFWYSKVRDDVASCVREIQMMVGDNGGTH